MVYVHFDAENMNRNQASRNECSPIEQTHVNFIFKIIR